MADAAIGSKFALERAMEFIPLNGGGTVVIRQSRTGEKVCYELVFKAITGSAVEMELGRCFRSGELMSFVHRGVELAVVVHFMAELDDARRTYEGTVSLSVSDGQAPPANGGTYV